MLSVARISKQKITVQYEYRLNLINFNCRWIKHGLVNGATGIIKDIIFPCTKKVDKNVLPTAVFIEFDYYTGKIPKIQFIISFQFYFK